MLLTTAALCLALNVYHEARGESLTGQHAVAQVTMNRADRDPSKICNVVFKPKQFSWANELTARKGADRARLAQKYVPKDDKAWQLAKSIAHHTVSGHVKDFTNGARFYHTVAVRPIWRKEFKLVAVIGQHKFYAYA